MSVEVKVPILPEEISPESVSVGRIYVSEGESVKADQLIFDIETEKVILEVISPEDGVVRNIGVVEGQTVKSEQVLMTMKIGSKVDHSVGLNRSNQNLENRVFIVHGHDEAALHAVARSLEKLGLEPIILHEQLNQGKTIIEKFEHFSARSAFAIVLMTPDDVGGKNAQNLSRRARQNVILELGYFAGLLGRDRVFVLKKENVEIPSDYMGVVYTDMDGAGAWKLCLAKELKNAGLGIDLSNVVNL